MPLRRPTTVLVGVKIFDSARTQISVSGDGSDPAVCTAVQQLQPHHACLVPANDFGFRVSNHCEVTVVGDAQVGNAAAR